MRARVSMAGGVETRDVGATTVAMEGGVKARTLGGSIE